MIYQTSGATKTTETGTIERVWLDKKFGFISRHAGPDVFFHQNDLDDLELDETLVKRRVQFDVTETEKGPRAHNVRQAV